MNVTVLSPETSLLLSQITGKKLAPQDITPPLIFLTALITVLIGVMFVDGTVTAGEKQRWQKTINKFISTQHSYRQLAQQITRGIQESQLHLQSDRLSLLVSPLSLPERLLLMALGYEMSAADGEMDDREKEYLTNIGLSLGIRSELLTVLESGFGAEEALSSSAISEVRDLLSPARFKAIESLFVTLPML